MREVWKSRREVKRIHLGSLLEAALVDLHATGIKQRHQMQNNRHPTTKANNEHATPPQPTRAPPQPAAATHLYPTRRLVALYRERHTALLEAHLKQEQGLKRDVGCKVRGRVPQPP